MTEPLLATEAPSNTEEPIAAPEATDSSSEVTTEQPVTEDPNPETAEAPPGAPENYEFTNPEGVPEGVEFDSQILDAYAEAARDLDLTQDKAQALFSKTMVAMHDRAVVEQQRQATEWTEATKSDPEIGGDKLDENIGIAKKAMKEFGSDGLSELLNSNIGNHPEVIRFLVRVGKAVSEDGFVGSGRGPTVDLNDDAALARTLYPSNS